LEISISERANGARISQIEDRKFMKVLVTGGTGFVGREIVRQLHNTGHQVHLLARNADSPATKEVAAQFGAKVHPGNVFDAESLWDACTGMEAVIHLVGIIGEAGDQTFENVHTRGTRNILYVAKDARLKRFLHMSALGTRSDAISSYHQTKWAAEEQVRRSGLSWTIFRPSIIYGPGDGFVTLFAKIIRSSPVVPIVGNGRTRFQPVSVKSVATAFVKALSEPTTIGATYDLCGEETFTLDEIVNQILDVMQKRRLKLHVPIGVARYPAALLEFVFPHLFRKAPPLSRDQLVMLQEDNVGNPESADQLFGLKPLSFRQEIARYLR
jgi:uncharacterized protein YbjT (DUF2867 family)